MKTLKINFAILAAVLGLTAVFAFKAPANTNSPKFGVVWFTYNGGPLNMTSSYDEIAGTPSCNGSGDLCAIRGEEQGTTGHPQASVLTDPNTQKRKFD